MDHPSFDSGLTEAGFVLLTPSELAREVGAPLSELDAWRPAWERLPRDPYLRDGGHYRSRRHACFVQRGNALEQTPARAHWQPTSYNALHGGLERWFAPIVPEIAASPAWTRLLCALGTRFSALHATPAWFIEAHQFRIDTAEGIGRPTPEGAHRDGVDFVAVILVNRTQVRGGETRVFLAQGNAGLRFIMLEPWTALLLDDARVIHETTPIQPDQLAGVRDTLVLTYRASGFQAPPGG
ncbi:MAG TPA: 2OG-Fe dioxygenase family protein [Polyangiales bacterium]|nr:2OG-Fe dioxygenase family protein [Polyangiales bacterium]